MDELKNGQSSGATAASAATNQGARQEDGKKQGVQDVNGDGKVDFKDYVATAAKAASDACQDAAAVIKEKAPQFAQKAKDVAGDVKGAFAEAAETVKEKTPEYVQKAKDAAENVKGAFAEAAETVKEKTPEYVQKAKDAAENVKDAFAEAAETVKEKTPEYVQKAKDAFANVFDHKEPAAAEKDAASAAPQPTDDTAPKA